MYQFLLVVHALVAAALVGVILMQRSEGGGLAGGGNPAGLMTARGAADLLTRTTTILAVLFVTLSIAMAAIATINRTPSTIDTSLAKKVEAPAPIVPMAGGTETAVPEAATPNQARPVEQKPSAVPLASSKRNAEPSKAQSTAPKPQPLVQKPAEKVAKPAEKAAAPAVETPAATPPAETAPQ